MRSVLLTSIEVPPPTATAADILARADSRQAKPTQRQVSTRPFTGRLAVGASASVLVAALVVGLGIFLLQRDPGYAAAPAMLDMPTTSDEPADRWLNQLLINLDKSPPDQPSLDGVTTRHYQDWLMPTPPEPQIVAKDIRTWWRPDLSGEIVTTNVVQPSDSRAAILEISAGQQGNRETFGPGQYNTLVDRPSEDPNALLRQLNMQEPLENGPQSIPRAIASFCTRHQLNRHQRAAMLKLLKNMQSLRFYGEVADRARRTGLAFGVDSPLDSVSGQTRDILVLDQHGNVLSHEIISLVSPAKMQLPAFTVIAYALFL